MLSALVTLAVLVVVWIVVWFAFLRHYLMQYKIAADVIGRIERAEGDVGAQVSIWLEGKKALMVAFLTSLFGAGKAAIDSTVSTAASLTPTDVAPLHDPGIWQAFFSDAWVLRIMSGLAIVTAFLTVRGHVVAQDVMAAKLEPKG